MASVPRVTAIGDALWNDQRGGWCILLAAVPRATAKGRAPSHERGGLRGAVEAEHAPLPTLVDQDHQPAVFIPDKERLVIAAQCATRSECILRHAPMKQLRVATDGPRNAAGIPELPSATSMHSSCLTGHRLGRAVRFQREPLLPTSRRRINPPEQQRQFTDLDLQ